MASSVFFIEEENRITLLREHCRRATKPVRESNRFNPTAETTGISLRGISGGPKTDSLNPAIAEDDALGLFVGAGNLPSLLWVTLLHDLCYRATTGVVVTCIQSLCTGFSELPSSSGGWLCQQLNIIAKLHVRNERGIGTNSSV